MTPHEIIEAAKAAGYELWPDGKVIDFKPKPMRDKGLANCIRANKPKLLEALRRREQSIVAAFDAAICWREYLSRTN